VRKGTEYRLGSLVFSALYLLIGERAEKYGPRPRVWTDAGLSGRA
jgi:hypothetical protein